MISVRRAAERYYEHRRKDEVWHTFHAGDGQRPERSRFGVLEDLDERRIRPGAGLPYEHERAAEAITYVREGSLAYVDSCGGSSVIRAGEFQQRSISRGTRHTERNPARRGVAHIYQIWLCPLHAAIEARHEQKRFSAAERRGVWRVIASPDGRQSSLQLDQDALMLSAMLDPGQHLVHELAEGRGAWLHLVDGEVTLGDIVLGTGDGAGVTTERAVSITAREVTEVLLVDLVTPQMPPPDCSTRIHHD